MLGRWLTDRIEYLVGRMVPRMPADRQEWGEAVVAEFAAIPPGARRLRWALGGLWFVLRRCAAPARQPAVSWSSRAFSILGVIGVLPWALVSIQGITETDAPDATMRSMVAMLVAQCVLVVAFVATYWPWRTARALVMVALVGYVVTNALAAADNNGDPLLAALIFVIPPTMAAVPILLLQR
jgi:hypothetical protein